jgi:MOSC domain-containing protein YiiM
VTATPPAPARSPPAARAARSRSSIPPSSTSCRPPVDHRRNVVIRGTDPNGLVGRDFTLGDVHCRGRRLCEPCAHLNRLNGGALLRPMVHCGGLRADILSAGTLRVRDRLVPAGAS